MLVMPVVTCSVDIRGMFEGKGVTNASNRLTFAAADVREPFPQCIRQAKVS